MSIFKLSYLQKVGGGGYIPTPPPPRIHASEWLWYVYIKQSYSICLLLIEFERSKCEWVCI